MTVGALPLPAVAGISPRTSSRSPNGVTSASPPERLTRSASHWAARTTSCRCAGSALTEGIAMNSRSSSSQACSTAADSTRGYEGWAMMVEPDLPCPASAGAASTSAATTARAVARVFLRISRILCRDVFELLAVRQSAQLLETLVFDLANPLARYIERAPDLVQRPRMLAVEPVAKLEHLPLAGRQRPEDLEQRLLPQRHLGRLVGELLVLVGEEVPELGLVLVTDRLLQRDRRLGAAADVVDLVDREVELPADLEG